MSRRYGNYNNTYEHNYLPDQNNFVSNDTFPKFKILCETENHIGYINVPPKKEFQNPEGYALIDAELYKLTKNRISYIQKIEESGITKYLYRRPSTIKLESDLGWCTSLKITADRKNAMYIFLGDESRSISGSCSKFLQLYFDGSSASNKLSISGSAIDYGEDVGKKLQKKKHHNRYNIPQKAAQESPIEKIFREELTKRNIEFEEQVEIILEGKKFSVPDFVIRHAGLIVYCDGTEFHKSPERIIMDKQQDRALQANGFDVFRFSGSEIASNVRACVDEVVGFIGKKKTQMPLINK